MSFDITKFDFFDTHCHLNLLETIIETDAIIEDARNKKVFMNCIGVDYSSSIKAINIVKENRDCCICSVGIHPESVDEIGKLDELEQLIIDNKEFVYGIGECGLDFHYENYDPVAQTVLFKAQIKLAIKYNLPLIVHCRDAYDELYDILKEYKNKLPKVLIHCYDSNSEWVQKFNEFKCYFAVGGKVTFPKSDYLRESIIYMPENRLVCETDSPWLSPWPNRSKKNEPANVIAIIEYISNLLKNDEKSIVFNNSVELFNLPHKN